MSSISALRARLAAAQSKKATARLSNIQCIDILLKICRKCNVELVPSNDGLVFYTIEEVTDSIINLLYESGGRVPVYELSTLLNVQEDYVSRGIQTILGRKDNTLLLVHGILLTSTYIDSLARSIDDRVQECGTVDLTELSKEFNLPLDLLRDAVQKTKMQASLSGNTLVSYTFEERRKNNVRAALAAVTIPIKVHDLSRITGISSNIVDSVLHKYTGGTYKNGEYTPKCYLDAVERFIKQTYAQAGYIEKSVVQSYSHVNAEYMKKVCADSMVLANVYINSALTSPVSVLVNEAVSGRTWREITSMLPSVLDEKDWSVLLKNAKGVLIESIFVSEGFLEDLKEHVLKKIEAGISDTSDLENLVDSLLSSGDDHFSELHMLYPSQLYSHVEANLKKALAKKAAKPVQTKKKGVDLDALKQHVMRSELTIKTLSKLGIESTLLLQNLTREVLTPAFHMLLEHHLQGIGEDAQVNAQNRGTLVEKVADKEVKAACNDYISGIRAKDAVVCMDACNLLCKYMYINCNVKKESKAFIRTEQLAHLQKMSSFTCVDYANTCLSAIMLALLKNNHYIYMNEKAWCLKEVCGSFKAVLESCSVYTQILEVVEGIEDPQEEKRLQDATAAIIENFKTS